MKIRKICYICQNEREMHSKDFDAKLKQLSGEQNDLDLVIDEMQMQALDEEAKGNFPDMLMLKKVSAQVNSEANLENNGGSNQFSDLNLEHNFSAM